MYFSSLFVLLSVLVSVTLSADIYSNSHGDILIRARRSAMPGQRAMMFHGYYARPNRRSEGSMTAFAAGDSVAAGTTYSHPSQVPCSGCVPEQSNANVDPEEVNDGAAVAEASAFGAPQSTQEAQDENSGPQIGSVVDQAPVYMKKPQAAKKPPQIPDEEEEEDEIPVLRRKGGVPSYNAFFPIVFGGFPSEKTKDASGPVPGMATAIANSFSLSKGGSATSRATAYGSPSDEVYFRSKKL